MSEVVVTRTLALRVSGQEFAAWLAGAGHLLGPSTEVEAEPDTGLVIRRAKFALCDVFHYDPASPDDAPAPTVGRGLCVVEVIRVALAPAPHGGIDIRVELVDPEEYPTFQRLAEAALAQFGAGPATGGAPDRWRSYAPKSAAALSRWRVYWRQIKTWHYEGKTPAQIHQMARQRKLTDYGEDTVRAIIRAGAAGELD